MWEVTVVAGCAVADPGKLALRRRRDRATHEARSIGITPTLRPPTVGPMRLDCIMTYKIMRRGALNRRSPQAARLAASPQAISPLSSLSFSEISREAAYKEHYHHE